MDIKDIKAAVRKSAKLSENEIIVTTDTPRFGWDNPKYSNLEIPVRSVISSYQNANRWLDTIKEHILITLHCPYFSNIVHQLAHTMPARFDAFGDIIHKENLEIPYPSTEEWKTPVGDMPTVIHTIYEILDAIRYNLKAFKTVAEENDCLEMSLACDALLLDIHKEYEFFIRAEDMLAQFGNNLVRWDKYVYEYYKNQSNLI